MEDQKLDEPKEATRFVMPRLIELSWAHCLLDFELLSMDNGPEETLKCEFW